MNPYLKKLMERHEQLRAGMEELQTRATTEARDLTTDELESVKGRSAEAAKLFGEITVLMEQEERSAAVANMQTTLATARKTSDASAVDRDPGHYRSASEGGQHSFFSDLYRQSSNPDAAERLRAHSNHMRAETTASLPGVIPPKWLADLYTTMGQQDAALWNNIAKYPIADARPFSLPGQTGVTTTTTQAAENDALTDGDGYNAAAATITPVTITGQETISRQLLDASNPTIDQLILDDLQRSYIAQRENRIGVAIRAVGTPYTVSYGDFSNPAAAGYAYDLVVDASIFVRKGLLMRPTFLATDYDAFALLLKLKDSAGRPLVVDTPYGPQNVAGMASLLADGTFAKLPLVVSEGMNPTADAADAGLAVVHGPSVVGFESAGMTFRYEEVAGPQSIRLGLWKYFAVAVRQSTRAVKNILVDDDTADES
jgi:HK97 family phage major capsid protein